MKLGSNPTNMDILRLNGQGIMKLQSCYLKEFVGETLNRL